MAALEPLLARAYWLEERYKVAAMFAFRIPLYVWVDNFVDGLLNRFSGAFDGFGDMVSTVLDGLLWLLQSAHPLLIVLSIALLALWLAGWRVGLFALLGLLLIENIGLWSPFIATLALVLTAQLLILVVGLPVGILMASSKRLEQILQPVLDFMQTMPAFVYLIPAVMFFGLGIVPGVVATFVFALPPLVRLTSLGIRQVPHDLIEASEAFGSTYLQKLLKVQLPVALPTIMAGVNQSIMLNLSMVVISAMIAAGGLGAEVLRGIQRLEIGRGFEAGLAVVILAIVLDRITASVGKDKHRQLK